MSFVHKILAGIICTPFVLFTLTLDVYSYGSSSYPNHSSYGCYYYGDCDCDYYGDCYYGCTDPEATNYDSSATDDDGSCEYEVYGCTDPEATNYDSSATDDDGSCMIYGCTNDSADNYDAQATYDDGSCIVGGCTNSDAENYDPDATKDDGSCIMLGCTDPDAENYDSDATDDDGSCVISGCTDSDAKNYDSSATDDDGSCEYDCTGNVPSTAVACGDTTTDVDNSSYSYTPSCADLTSDSDQCYYTCPILEEWNEDEQECEEKSGCTDPDANNYDPDVPDENDDGSCRYDCTGNIPDNGDACNEDTLSVDHTPYMHTDECPNNSQYDECFFTCDSGYDWNSDTQACEQTCSWGSDQQPANSTVCGNKSHGGNVTYENTYQCDDLPSGSSECYFECDDGYFYIEIDNEKGCHESYIEVTGNLTETQAGEVSIKSWIDEFTLTSVSLNSIETEVSPVSISQNYDFEGEQGEAKKVDDQTYTIKYTKHKWYGEDDESSEQICYSNSNKYTMKYDVDFEFDGNSYSVVAQGDIPVEFEDFDATDATVEPLIRIDGTTVSTFPCSKKIGSSLGRGSKFPLRKQGYCTVGRDIKSYYAQCEPINNLNGQYKEAIGLEESFHCKQITGVVGMGQGGYKEFIESIPPRDYTKIEGFGRTEAQSEADFAEKSGEINEGTIKKILDQYGDLLLRVENRCWTEFIAKESAALEEDVGGLHMECTYGSLHPEGICDDFPASPGIVLFDPDA